MRETSLEAYEFLKNSGALTAMQDRVVATLAHVGPYPGDRGISPYSRTASELAQEMKLPRDSVSPRLAELRRRGLVEEAETRECMVTGRRTNAFVIAAPEKLRENVKRARVKVLPRKQMAERLRICEEALEECVTENGAPAIAFEDVEVAVRRLREINRVAKSALMGSHNPDTRDEAEALDAPVTEAPAVDFPNGTRQIYVTGFRGDQKIQYIKLIYENLCCGLKRAKEYADNSQFNMTVTREEYDRLLELGAVFHLVDGTPE